MAKQKKKRKRQQESSEGVEEGTAEDQTEEEIPLHHLVWWKKAFFGLMVSIAFFALSESVLYIAGVQPTLYEEDPYVGFEARIPLFVETSGVGQTKLETAGNKQRFFNYQQFPKSKPDGTTRIFCLGGSTTYGRPYDDKTSFCGWLRELLPAADPSRKWEVINAGGISYASYRVAALMEELAQYQPDIFIVYCGHNEFLERRTYAGIIETPAPIRGLNLTLSKTRSYSLMKGILKGRPGNPGGERPTVLSSEVNTILDQSFGPEAYERDEELQSQVVAHYRYNLARMVDIAKSSGTRILLVTAAANLRHCSPFKSQPGDGLQEDDKSRWQESFDDARVAFEEKKYTVALALADQAVQVDPAHADTHYLRGRILDAVERYDEAKTFYQLAVDHDICPLRAISALEDVITEVAQERDVPVVDFVSLVESESPEGIPGENLFLDHVHPTIRGHRLLAISIIEEMADQSIIDLDDTWSEKRIDEITRRVESRMNSKRQGYAMRNVAQVMAWAGKKEDAYRAAKTAIELAPGDGEAHFLVGYLAQELGKDDEAEEHFRHLIEFDLQSKQIPLFYVNAHYRCALLLAKQYRFDESEALLEKALILKPDHENARPRLEELLAAQGDSLIRQGQPEAGERKLRRLIELQPGNVDARNKRAVALIQLNRTSEAVEELRTAIRVDPDYVPSHGNLGIALIQLKEYDQAEQALRRALLLAPNYEFARRNLELLQQEKSQQAP